jgi:hypothetical protein
METYIALKIYFSYFILNYSNFLYPYVLCEYHVACAPRYGTFMCPIICTIYLLLYYLLHCKYTYINIYRVFYLFNLCHFSTTHTWTFKYSFLWNPKIYCHVHNSTPDSVPWVAFRNIGLLCLYCEKLSPHPFRLSATDSSAYSRLPCLLLSHAVVTRDTFNICYV